MRRGIGLAGQPFIPKLGFYGVLVESINNVLLAPRGISVCRYQMGSIRHSPKLAVVD